MIDRLSQDLQREFPGQHGFSPRNLNYMRAFASAWPDTVIVQQADAQMAEARPPIVQRRVAQSKKPRSPSAAVVQAPLAPADQRVPAIVQCSVAQLPWRHHTILLDRLSTTEERLWYAAKSKEHGWSGDVLARQPRQLCTRRLHK